MPRPLRLAPLAAVALLSSGSLALARGDALESETKEQRDARMKWWRDARFGMFIHFGLYSTPAGEWKGKSVEGAGEWLQYTAKIPPAEYEPFLKQFDPENFDAKEWVRIAKDAGMKYITITSKHHEGFALFDSKLTDWKVTNTPFRRDIMKELSQECAKQGVKMCWYHSILDWHHPDYLPRGPGSDRPWDARPTTGASYDRYIEFMKGQLTELLTNYGPIGVIWFDGGWQHKAEEHHAAEVVALLRRLQPQIIINDRLNIPEDFGTPEQYIPATGLGDRDWETCMTMNDTWGYKVSDVNWKSTETLIRNLVDIASKGGNYLLNVGPRGDGTFPPAIVERLAAIGAWMRGNGESIYATTASPFKRLSFGRCTKSVGADGRSSRLYLHVFAWPQDGMLHLPGLRNKVGKAWLLGEPTRAGVSATRAGDEVVVTLGGRPVDPIDTVVALEIEGTPDVVIPPLRPGADGSLALDSLDATVHGGHAQYEADPEKRCIGFWTDPKDFVTWEFELAKPSAFSVAVEYACDRGTGGTECVVSLSQPESPGPELRFTVGETGSWTKFTLADVGKIPTLAAGRYTLAVKPLGSPPSAVMNLRAVKLSPAK